MIDIKFHNDIEDIISTQVFFIAKNLQIPSPLEVINKKNSNIISNFLANSKTFTGKYADFVSLKVLIENKLINIILVGCGDISELNKIKLENLGGQIFSFIKKEQIDQANIFAIHDDYALDISLGLLLAGYRFDKYKTKKIESKSHLFNIIVSEYINITDKFNDYIKPMQQAIYFTRDLVNEVPNVLNTTKYVQLIQNCCSNLNIDIQILNKSQMQQLGMNALLGVAQGSSSDPYVVVMKYNSVSSDDAPIALVGKGVVFDTGGISLKPSTNMHEMKYDMAGSAAVVGTIMALAAIKAKVNVVGILAIVENMPDGHAQRPGDVVVTMSGQTVEVLDTDAEGRLILADALWYVQSKFNPKAIIDIATLTGAITVALGNTFAGCFSNQDQLAQNIISAGLKVNEKLWHMPMHEDYDKMITSEVADWANIGNVRGAAGSAMGAHFLEKFVNNVPWVHLDIAGVAWEKVGKDIYPKGATGYGVRLLTEFICDNYEQR